MKSKIYYREVLGAKLRDFRKGRKYQESTVARAGFISIDQVKTIENGGDYTMDTFIGYIVGSNLYMYFAEKEEKSANEDEDDAHDFDQLINKGAKNNPGGTPQ